MNYRTDLELVEETRQRGDKRAFSVLLERHQAGAFRMAQRMISHSDTAREVVQEAMLQAYLSLPSLEKPERFQSWFYGIVINLCRSYLRSQHYDPLSLEALLGGLEASSLLLVKSTPDPQRVVEMRELHELVLAAIDTLSPQNREAVLLYYYEQLSLREISQIVGISTTAVKGRLHKSRRQLATYFAALADDMPWFAAPPDYLKENVLQERKPPMIEVQLVDVILPEGDKQGFHVLILLDEETQRILPIWVGPFEGHSIAIQLLENNPVQRPMTYDFMANLLQATGAALEEIQISTLQEGTYYATAMLRVGKTLHKIDARPSDAVALALRMKSKILVAENIMEKASKEIPEKYKNKMPRKGLEQLAAKLEQAKQEFETTRAKFREKEEKEFKSASEQLFAQIFGE